MQCFGEGAWGRAMEIGRCRPFLHPGALLSQRLMKSQAGRNVVHGGVNAGGEGHGAVLCDRSLHCTADGKTVAE